MAVFTAARVMCLNSSDGMVQHMAGGRLPRGQAGQRPTIGAVHGRLTRTCHAGHRLWPGP